MKKQGEDKKIKLELLVCDNFDKKIKYDLKL